MIRPYSRAFVMITASMYFMILAGCGGGDSSPTSPTPSTPTPPAPPPTPVATSLTVAPSSHTLAMIGATVQLSATVRDQNNNPMTGQTVNWTSSNTAVATVSGSGLVTAVSNGTTQITARSGNVSGTSNITVAEPVPTRIVVTPSSQTLEAIGATVQLSASVLDQRNNAMSGQTITWSSGDEAVATVSGTGLVTAVSNGMAEITARSGSLSDNATITVASPVATSITIEPAAYTLEAIGATVQLTATVLDQRENEMSDATVTWSSGDESVATVDENGLVSAVADGMAEITAQSGDAMGTAAISVAVFEPVATSITIEPASHTLEAIGATVQLAATVLDQRENAMMDVTVTWSSGDDAKATVDENGLVTAVDNGMAEITAQSGDVMGTAAITVSQVPANISIEVDAEATTLTEIGQTLQLMVSVSDANDESIAEPSVIWISSNDAVVTVDEDGLVTAEGNGMAEVTAASGDVSAKVDITVMAPVTEIEYTPWTGVKVAPGQLMFTLPGGLGVSIQSCASGLLGGELNNREAIGYTITVHYSVWQRSDDMGTTWTDIEATRVMYDACPYDPEVAGEYRLVGDITIDDDRSFRRSENTFVVDP
ncbi:MAG: Ig-like domain-containing protein [Gemmatimonadetes bacterium]|nr:Ig-like domain-containing protein [Gemmatimonadota bacterium]